MSIRFAKLDPPRGLDSAKSNQIKKIQIMRRREHISKNMTSVARGPVGFDSQNTKVGSGCIRSRNDSNFSMIFINSVNTTIDRSSGKWRYYNMGPLEFQIMRREYGYQSRFNLQPKSYRKNNG